MLGYCHTTISLICMSTHKAMAARCFSHHQATSGQHAIWALATAPLRRLALSVLDTIVTTSYQTTLYSLREIFNKRQHANTRHRVEFSHYNRMYPCMYTNGSSAKSLNDIDPSCHKWTFYPLTLQC